MVNGELLYFILVLRAPMLLFGIAQPALLVKVEAVQAGTPYYVAPQVLQGRCAGSGGLFTG